MSDTVCNVQYLDMQQISPTQQIEENYLREQIAQYGIDVSYLRSEANWFRTAGMQTANVQNYIYGDSPNARYYKIAEMIIYPDISSDSVALTKFGFQTASDANVYMLIQDFTHMFRTVLGYEQTIDVTIPINANISRYNGVLSGCSMINESQRLIFSQSLDYNDFNYYENNNVLVKTNIEICSMTGDGLTFIQNQVMNEYVYESNVYDNSCQLSDYNVSGIIPISNEVKRYGSGVICGNLSGSITFFSEYNEDNILLRPMAGDYLRLAFDDYNHVEYEITEVINQDLTPTGLNPLLSRYTWKCAIVRRSPSLETIDGVVESEEKLEIDNKEKINRTLEQISNEIFNYSLESNFDNDVDDVNADGVYGGMGLLYSEEIVNNVPETYTPYDPEIITDHERLCNLLGNGDINDHYHLTCSEFQRVVQPATVNRDGYLRQQEFVIFNNKQDKITTGTQNQYIKGDLSLGNISDILPDISSCINLVVDYVNVCINDVYTYIDICASTLNYQTYVDNCNSETRNYIDVCVSQIDYKTYVDACVGQIDFKTYTDICANCSILISKEYTDFCMFCTLSNFNNTCYIDTCVNILSNSTLHTDQTIPQQTCGIFNFNDIRIISSGTINRDCSNIITSIIKNSGRTITPTRDSNGYICSITDGTYTWYLERNINNFITSWRVQ